MVFQTDIQYKNTYPKPIYDGAFWFLGELGARVVAKSGIPSDRYHIGKLMLQSFKEAPEFIAQIDGATDESESFASLLERTVRCATALRSIGIQHGDVVAIMAPNHLHACVPYYAALCIGARTAALDRALDANKNEIQKAFSTLRPKLVFCQSTGVQGIQKAIKELNLESRIITFDKEDSLCSFQEFLDEHSDDTPVDQFRCTDFDVSETTALLVSTSGTTGQPKYAELTHKNLMVIAPYPWSRYVDYPTPTKTTLVVASMQWLTALLCYTMSPLLRFTRLQTSETSTKDHFYYLINTYKPTWTFMSPTFMATLAQAENKHDCDFTCFETILLGGNAVAPSLIQEMKRLSPKTDTGASYGMTELAGFALLYDGEQPISCGKPVGCLKYRLVDPATGDDIYKANTPGELWMKGPSVFKRYYNNPQATEEAFAEGGWLKSGDLFYRDEHNNYFFVERIKLLMKYKTIHVSPVELENVIREHPAVADVAVAGFPDLECGELPVAVVVKRPGSSVSSQDIKDLVKEKLSDPKQIRGGVIFVDKIPVTPTTKVDRRQLQKLVLTMPRE